MSTRRSLGRGAAIAFAAAACVVFLAGALAACGSGGPLTLDVYLKRVKAIDDETRTKLLTLGQLGPQQPDQLTDEQAVQEGQTAFQQALPVFKDQRNQLGGLHPPVAAEDAHKELLRAESDLADFATDITERSKKATTRAEINKLTEEFISGDRATDISNRIADACKRLQALADEYMVALDLGCAR